MGFTRHLLMAGCALLLCGQAALAGPAPLGTTFSYQGFISNGGAGVDEPVHLKCRLFNAAALGVQLGSELTLLNVPVTDGVFTVDLDFGAMFFNERRWLEIDVKLASSAGPFQTLSPRQEIRPAPLALFSLSTGVVPSAALSGSYSQAVSLNNAANVIAGSGSGLTSLNASNLASGTLGSGRLSGTYSNALSLSNVGNTIAGNGAGLTNLQWGSLAGVPAGFADGIDHDSGGLWLLSGPNIHYSGGNVGIGTTTPATKFDVRGPGATISVGTAAGAEGAIVLGNSSSGLARNYMGNPSHVGLWTTDGKIKLSAAGPNTHALIVEPGGNVGIGDDSPLQRLHVAGNAFVTGSIGIGTSTPTTQLDVRGPGAAITVGTTGNSEGALFLGNSSHGMSRNYMGNPNHVGLFTTSGKIKISADGSNGYAMCIVPGGFVGIGTDSPSQALDVNGNAIVNILTIRGGADLVEGFDTSHDDVLEPGTVVVIDPDNAGALMRSTEAYDIKVAGVVSGANGVQPGIHLGQQSVMDGDTKVAMTGRVYVKCSTENGPIKPGSLLTTASLAGHAMAATDASRSNGAVIGKAMSSLDEGSGLVLVLVNLQ